LAVDNAPIALQRAPALAYVAAMRFAGGGYAGHCDKQQTPRAAMACRQQTEGRNGNR
jgi:hypothetical protein